MAKTQAQIIEDINEHLGKSPKEYYSDFYIGITNDVKRRMFGEHRVIDDSWWIFRTAENASVARAVEKHFLDLGMCGDTGGGDEDSRIVYCYQISPTTIE